ncbi:hydrolase Cof [Sporosarcina sp. P21c]|uniref:Cof-type HAD-IIB family hydrolase n=1 Tax=unclassified Sporosarcina TaxID=2647733 RepID=UPI000C16DCAB|nr:MULTISPECIES: Cof-type HAD-IIB family hydrolase [unclassified Sporosarcina]PIC67384.1 hydrolase Cof [Sporosarcina sp. P16a]PIC89640.1 hydrolase Cof [Sporosarcina sp. P21c]PIC92835.1 hydrolase Cof [Sporosarcina sp. P25]
MNLDKKIVFFDLDGTLMNHDKTILESTKQSLTALREKGIYTVICTGRAPLMFNWLLEELSFDSYVSMNGQHVVLDGEVIYSNPMKPEVIRQLTEFAHKQGHGLTYSTFESFVTNVEEHPLVQEGTARLKIPYPPVDPNVYSHSVVNQVQIYSTPKETKKYMELFKDYTFIRWDENSVDMLPEGASKAIGIQKMLEQMNIPIENSYAFGDGANDMQMIKMVGIGVAMENAIPELKEVADLVTASCSEDGIMKGLISLGLLEEKDIPLLHDSMKQ